MCNTDIQKKLEKIATFSQKSDMYFCKIFYILTVGNSCPSPIIYQLILEFLTEFLSALGANISFYVSVNVIGMRVHNFLKHP